MPCPDDVTLELWLAEALPAGEQAEIARHLEGCADCHERALASRHEAGALTAALALGEDELAFLAGADLAGRWRPAGQPAPWWGWCALLVTLGSVASWALAWPLVARALEQAGRAGLGSVVLQALLGALWALGTGSFTIGAGPLTGSMLALLGLIGLALLAGPRPPTSQQAEPGYGTLGGRST